MASVDNDLSAQIKISRRQEMNFGICLGTAAEDTVLILDRKKAPEILARTARKESSGNKVTQGVCLTDGKLITLTCEDPPPGISKKLKKYLKTLKLAFNIQILLTDGTIFESNIDEEDAENVNQSAAPTGGAQTESDTEDNVHELAWNKAKADLTSAIRQAIEGNGPQKANIIKIWKVLSDRVSAGEFEAALSDLPKFAALLKANAETSGDPDAPEPEASQNVDSDPQIGDRLKAAIVTVKASLAKDPSLKNALVGDLTAANTAWKSMDMAACTEALDRLDATLSSPSSVSPAELAAELRDIWDEAKSITDRQLESLLRKVAADPAPEAKLVVDIGLNAWSKGANTNLMKAILELQSSPQDKIKNAAKKAADACSAYDNFLAYHPAVEVMDTNTMNETVSLRQTLGGALKEMRKRALAA